MHHSEILRKHGFAIERKLGQGGFGEVLLVKHEISQQLYALKTLNNKRKQNPEDILREIKAIAALKHPNLSITCSKNLINNSYTTAFSL